VATQKLPQDIWQDIMRKVAEAENLEYTNKICSEAGNIVSDLINYLRKDTKKQNKNSINKFPIFFLFILTRSKNYQILARDFLELDDLNLKRTSRKKF
jgi:hypothetical protein